MLHIKCKGMINVTLIWMSCSEYKKLNFLFTILYLVMFVPSFSSFMEVSMRMNDFNVSEWRVSILFPESQVK